MLLAIDVGNSNMVLGLYGPEPDSAQQHSWRISTPLQGTLDELQITLHSLFALHHVDPRTVTGIAIASVVPPIDTLLRSAVERFFGIKPLFIEPGVKTGMPIRTDTPTELGADRLVDCVAAYARYGAPCIVVDMGTATTFDVVSAHGEYIGGAIAPGLGISADALFRAAARLSRVDIRRPSRIIGTNTVEHIQIGLYHGYIGLIDGICSRMLAELGTEAKVIATGGFAKLLADDSNTISLVDENLTLDGIRLVYERNRQARRSRTPATASALAE